MWTSTDAAGEIGAWVRTLDSSEPRRFAQQASIGTWFGGRLEPSPTGTHAITVTRLGTGWEIGQVDLASLAFTPLLSGVHPHASETPEVFWSPAGDRYHLHIPSDPSADPVRSPHDYYVGAPGGPAPYRLNLDHERFDHLGWSPAGDRTVVWVRDGLTSASRLEVYSSAGALYDEIVGGERYAGDAYQWSQRCFAFLAPPPPSQPADRQLLQYQLLFALSEPVTSPTYEVTEFLYTPSGLRFLILTRGLGMLQPPVLLQGTQTSLPGLEVVGISDIPRSASLAGWSQDEASFALIHQRDDPSEGERLDWVSIHGPHYPLVESTPAGTRIVEVSIAPDGMHAAARLRAELGAPAQLRIFRIAPLVQEWDAQWPAGDVTDMAWDSSGIGLYARLETPSGQSELHFLDLLPPQPSRRLAVGILPSVNDAAGGFERRALQPLPDSPGVVWIRGEEATATQAILHTHPGFPGQDRIVTEGSQAQRVHQVLVAP